MNSRMVMLGFALCVSLNTKAQEEVPATGREFAPGEEPEEIVVIGQRYRFQLHQQMLDAERNAYEIFNQFNDEKRFEIDCSTGQRVGSHVKEQVCQPAFKREALANEGRVYLDAYREYLNTIALGRDPAQEAYSPPVLSLPSAAGIAAQQGEYQDKMKQVAEEHPEFLEALIKYSEIKTQYEAVNSMPNE